jgi:archaellum component FlaF (FlaF/FlaG flagellin family)
MGLSDVIATGITVIALLVTGYLIIASLNSSVDTANASLAAVRDSADARLHTSLALDINDTKPAYLDFNLTNVGKTPVDNLSKLDVFVKTIEGGQVVGCAWLPFRATPAGDGGYWYVLGRPGAFAGDTDSLEPGDTATVRCVYQSPDYCDGVLEVSAPGGADAIGYYRIRGA